MAPERSAKNTWIEDHNKDGSRDFRDLAEFKERVRPDPGHQRRRHRRPLADLMEGFNDDPTWDVAGGILHHDGEICSSACRPASTVLPTMNNETACTQTATHHDQRGLQHPPGVRRPRHLRRDPRSRRHGSTGKSATSASTSSTRPAGAGPIPNQGAVLRAKLDGSDFEVFATGIRNLQEFSFDEHGNLISVDNDGDHQGENERLVYIPNGSDSGWRSNWQYGKYTDAENNRYNVWMDEEMFKPRFERQAAHIVPPVAPWHAGPSGMVYNPGTALSEEWRNHFFVSSFPGAPSNARIYAFRLKEDGAGFALDRRQSAARAASSPSA